jgi:hypothetical protein
MWTANAPNKSIMDLIFWAIVWIRLVSSKWWIFQLDILLLSHSLEILWTLIWMGYGSSNRPTKTRTKNIQQFWVWELVVVWDWFCIATIHLVKSHHTLELIFFLSILHKYRALWFRVWCHTQRLFHRGVPRGWIECITLIKRQTEQNIKNKHKAQVQAKSKSRKRKQPQATYKPWPKNKHSIQSTVRFD